VQVTKPLRVILGPPVRAPPEARPEAVTIDSVPDVGLAGKVHQQFTDLATILEPYSIAPTAWPPEVYRLSIPTGPRVIHISVRGDTREPAKHQLDNLLHVGAPREVGRSQVAMHY